MMEINNNANHMVIVYKVLNCSAGATDTRNKNTSNRQLCQTIYALYTD